MKNNIKILVCDENNEERGRLLQNLAGYGIACDEAKDGESAFEMIKRGSYDVVITDLWLSGVDGIGIIRAVKALGIKSEPSFILMSPINKQSILVEASDAGADLCILKPFDLATLHSHIESLVRIKKRDDAQPKSNVKSPLKIK